MSSCYEDNKEEVTVCIATVRQRLKEGWSLEQALLHPKKKTLTTRLGEHFVEGKAYENLCSIAQEYDMPFNTIYKRYSRGCRGDELVPLKKRRAYTAPKEDNQHRFVAGGVEYRSAAEACRRLGVKYVTYRNRIRNGHTIEQALGIIAVEDGRVTRGKKYDADGTYRTIKELAEFFSVPEPTIRDRLQRGATIRQALGLEEISNGSHLKQCEVQRTKRAAIRLEVDGEIFRSYKALADKYGLPQYTVRQRIVDYGYTPENAVKLDGKSKPITVEGVEYPSKAALAEAYGLTPAVLLARLAGDVTVEQALGIEQRETLKSIDFEGEIFCSLTDLANKKNIPIGALRSRIKSGLSLKEAIDAGDRIRNSGRYNLTILERDEHLAHQSAWLYFVRIVINGKERFKIGITTQTVADRLKQEAYEFATIKVVRGTLMDCFILEQEIIDLLSDKRDLGVTSSMLDGYSEVFNLDDGDVKFISDFLGA